MKLVEKHVIKSNHGFYKEIDNLAWLSKNLYNQANYLIRQSFIKEAKYLNYNSIQKILQNQSDYKFLPAKVSQQILKTLDKNWSSFFSLIKDFKINPGKYLSRPKLPKYKDKVKGRNILVYTIQAISKKELKNGIIKLSKTNIKIKTDKTNIQQVRIIPKNKEYVIEVIYNKEELISTSDRAKFISIDIGLNNLASITSNKVDFKSTIINGRVLKSINAYYNKKKSLLQSFIGDRGYSNRITKLTNKRNKKIADYLHRSSKYIIDMCLNNDIGTIVIGKNKQWKQEINIGSKNNQAFVSIPHARLIDMIEYKAKLKGLDVIITEESYTSKCSFLDNEAICKHDIYLGKRVKRGLFKSSNNIKINADINASLNIARKVIPNFNINNIEKGIQGIVVSPIRVNPYKLKA